MKRNRRVLLGVAVLSVCVAFFAGCRRRSSSHGRTTDDDIFTTDDFPGSSVQDGNVADDLRAFSPSGIDINPGSLTVTTNGDRGTAMATYSGTGVSGGGTFLYAQHFDGETWTPPVQLEALDVSFLPGSGFAAAATVHAFLNTSGHDSDLARDRDGDCLIAWRWDDLVSASDDVNQALFVTYFDVTLRDSVADRHGFQEIAARIDVQDELDEDVIEFGVLSDGVRGEARWIDGARSYSYGDDTTRIAVFFRQAENNDGDPAVEDRALYVVEFPLTQAGDPAVPLAPEPADRVSTVNFGYSDAGATSHETSIHRNLVSYNNLLAFVMAPAVGGNLAPDTDLRFFFGAGTELVSEMDVTIQVAALDLDTGSLNPTTALRTSPVVAGDTFRNNAQFPHSSTFLQGGRCMYGSDEGIATALVLFGEYTDVTALFDFRAAVWRIAEVNEADGSLISVGSFSVSDPDEFDGAFGDGLSTVLSRNGDALWMIWGQAFDATPGAGNDGSTFGVFVAQYITTRLPDDGSTPVIPPTTDTLSPPVLLGAPTATAVVSWFAPQGALGYVCGNQSDPDSINVFFEMSDGTGDTVWIAELEADLTSPPLLAPVVSVFEGFENGDQSPLLGVLGPQPGFNSLENQTSASGAAVSFMAVDGGHDGNVIAAYVDDVDGTAVDDYRVFSENTGPVSPGVLEIGSNDPVKTTALRSIRWMEATPPGSEIGTFDPVSGEDDDRRSRPAELVHIFFSEPETSDVDGLGFALRTRAFSTADNGESFGNNFRPAAGTPFLPPFDLDLPGLNPPPVTAPALLSVLSSGNHTGLFFTEDGHVYYQEWFDGNVDEPNEVAWNSVESELPLGLPASNPFLLDDDSSTKFTTVEGVFARTTVCDRIDGAMVFWSKRLDTVATDKRLQVRVRMDD